MLRWYGYFKEAVPESPRETHRVRRVVFHFYLVDDTMDVEEPRQLNSGIDQVRLLCLPHLAHGDHGKVQSHSPEKLSA